MQTSDTVRLAFPTIVYSVILPAHNEAENLPQVVAEIDLALQPLGRRYEIIVVDDGSSDDTPQVLRSLSAEHPELRSLRFNRNFGQSAGVDAGFRAARGDIFVLLDADGQNPPSEIPKLLAALDDADMVCGWRRVRHDSWVKIVFSKFANLVRRSILSEAIHDTGCSLKAFRRESVERLKLFHGMHRYLPALVRMEGWRVREIEVAHRPRVHGRSHYGIFNRMLGPMIDLLVVRWMQSRCRPWRMADPSLNSNVAPIDLRQAG
ncbi:MAG TPA: glycosyltransferase family 2 protein [Planctomycetaceae bacterium]|nr:glycosyltransferase family 2 protein [Planctomycetaceae bacterium]